MSRPVRSRASTRPAAPVVARGRAEALGTGMHRGRPRAGDDVGGRTPRALAPSRPRALRIATEHPTTRRPQKIRVERASGTGNRCLHAAAPAFDGRMRRPVSSHGSWHPCQRARSVCRALPPRSTGRRQRRGPPVAGSPAPASRGGSTRPSGTTLAAVRSPAGCPHRAGRHVPSAGRAIEPGTGRSRATGTRRLRAGRPAPLPGRDRRQVVLRSEDARREGLSTGIGRFGPGFARAPLRPPSAADRPMACVDRDTLRAPAAPDRTDARRLGRRLLSDGCALAAMARRMAVQAARRTGSASRSMAHAHGRQTSPGQGRGETAAAVADASKRATERARSRARHVVTDDAENAAGVGDGHPPGVRRRRFPAWERVSGGALARRTPEPFPGAGPVVQGVDVARVLAHKARPANLVVLSHSLLAAPDPDASVARPQVVRASPLASAARLGCRR